MSENRFYCDLRLQRQRSSRRTSKIFLVILLLSICITRSLAQDPIYSLPWKQQNRRAPPLLSPSSHRSGAALASTRTPYYRKDYNDKFLDVDSFQREKNARLWKVNLKTRRRGVWVSRLVMTNIAIFALQQFNPRITQMGVKLSDKILNGQELYRLLTPVFLHGGLAHLCVNMFSLKNIGPDVESLFGPGRFLCTYLGAGIAGNIMSAIRSPNPALGASGAVFGIIGAQYVFLNRNDWLLGRQGKRMEDAIVQNIGLNLLVGFINPVVDNWAHLGGLIGGAAVAYYFGPRLFLLELPNGGRAIVDKPVFRLPRSIESIPDDVGKRYQRVMRRMQINQHVDNLPDKPWRRPPKSNYQRQQLPN